MAVRHKRIDARFRDASLADLRSLPIEIDPETDRHAWAATLKLAERCKLTLYDAAYLELARRVGLPLASLDQQLRAAATSISVPLRGK
jgi:predicted nucleic acid-binding protein